MKRVTTSVSLIAITLLSVFSLSNALADDTEIYLNRINLPAEQVRPNVVFILDSSGSMGLPIKQFGQYINNEKNSYNSATIYPGSKNMSGGAGDSNYYYFYTKSTATYAGQYIYYNKVHSSQMTCNMSTLADTTPYTNTSDKFIFNNGTPNWGPMCDENSNNCRFTAAAAGALVDCNAEKNHIANNNAYFGAANLYVVSANFHNFLQSYYRYSVLQTVVKDLIDRPFDINMSVMKFQRSVGGLVIKESVNANVASNQADLKATVNGISFNGSTPLTGALWEASRYLRGETATHGSIAQGGVRAAFVNGSTTYNSPIDYSCQKSHIILLTDGEPTYDYHLDSAISSLTRNDCQHDGNGGNNVVNTPEESCLDNLAQWLHTDITNLPTKIRDHSAITLDQSINVHTIGFGLDNELLTVTARKGNGLNKSASTASELAEAFSTIIDQATFEKDTFVAPAVAVNAYNGLQHRDELYFALFQPNANPRWNGNIKKFKLDGDTIKDQNNKAAIDKKSGYFKETSLSYWTTLVDYDKNGSLDPDGAHIDRGGFAAELTDPTARTIYTYTGIATPKNLTLSEQFDDANTAITGAMLSTDGTAVSAAERTAIINWSRGGVTDTPPPNFFMADFIHSRPSVVTYQTFKTVNNGVVTNVTFDDTLYAGSNMGLLHAIDADDGKEVFSFLPKEMFSNTTTYYKATGRFIDKVYGLDAPMTVWRFDENNDGNIINRNGTVDGNDFVYIYQPMRRGGTSIYALDVTLRPKPNVPTSTGPKLMWQINGTAYTASPSGDFRNLAQTWSTPQRGKIKWNCSVAGCTDKNVLFFGGGYDTAYDNKLASPTTTNKGNAIYMVDAITGELLWSAGNGTNHDVNLTTMNSSIPADVTTGDTDSDGFIDVLFAVDIRGGLWRMDFADTPSTAKNFATGGKIADLSGGTGPNFRRFFNAPDVAFFAKRGNTPFLTISVSSGYRAHPRDTTIDDYLFVIFDNNALIAPASNNYNYVNGTSTITFSNLGISPLSTKYGWQKALTGVGEKGLSRTVTFGDQIIMTTYVPDNSVSCISTTGSGRRYLLNALTGVSLLTDRNGNSVDYADLIHGGIPPEPAVIYTTEEKCIANCNGTGTPVLEKRPNLIVCVGTECIDDVVDQKLHKMFWREN